jgi:ABC-type sugar transport system permease subunit
MMPDGKRSGGNPASATTLPGAGGKHRRFGSMWFERRALPMLLVLPAFLLIFGLVFYPVLRTLWLSFTDAGLDSLVTGEVDFVGLENYAEIVTDAHLQRVFLVTAVFGLSCVLGTMLLGLAVALLLNQSFKGRVLFGVLILLPWAVPRVGAAIVWRWMFNDQYGIVNWSLSSIGLRFFDGFAWLNSALPAFVAIGVVVVWQSFPFVALSLLAGLQSIPPEVIEAAKLDGATSFQRLRLVILPMLKPLILVLVVISTIWDFKIFDQVYVMTGGGPARSTEVLEIATWREAFTQLDFGLGSALAIALFVVLVLITALYIRLIREEELA